MRVLILSCGTGGGHNAAASAMKEALEAWTGTLESVFATRSDVEQKELEDKVFDAGKVYTAANKIAKPKVFIPVLNCS